MPKASLVQFSRLIKQTESILQDIQSQFDPNNPRKLSILKVHLEAEYQNFLTKLEVYDNLEVLPVGLEENQFIQLVQSIKTLHLNVSSEIQLLNITLPLASDSKDELNVRSTSSPKVKLPKLQIPKFSGKFTDWTSFIAKFESIVHSSSELNNLEKFQYLLTSLEDEPLKIIEHLALIDANYERALSILKNRYHNPKRQIAFHCEKLLSINSIEGRSTESIRNFLDAYNMHFNSLSSIENIDVYKVFFTTFILSRFDKNLASRFESKHSDARDFPDIELILAFLESQAIQGENVETFSGFLSPKPASKPNSQPNPKPSSRLRPVATLLTTNNPTCKFCKNPMHKPSSCSVFLKKTPKQRFDLVKTLQLCINCLGSHYVTACNSKFVCRTCAKHHHSLLHFESRSTPPAPAQPSPSVANEPIVPEATAVCNNASLTTNLFDDKTVLLPTVLVCLKVSDTQYVVARAVIDTASHVSFVSENCAQLLRCRRNKVAVPIAGIGETPTSSNGVSFLQITSLAGNLVSHSHPFFILNKITSNLPRSPVDTKIRSSLSHFTFADPSFDMPSPIDVLLGADLSASVIMGTPYQQRPDLPFVLQTVFGFAVLGSISSSPPVRTNLAVAVSALCSLNVVTEDNLLTQLQNFWSYEEPPHQVLTSPEDKFCEEFYSKTTTRDTLGRYQVRLPFKADSSQNLGNSFDFAHHCLRTLEQKFGSNPEFKSKYIDFMQEYHRLGHVIPLPLGMKPKIFIPHHGIFKTHGDSSKLRVVFNASAVSSSGKSLNSLLCAGPKLQPSISDVIIRFRCFAFVFSCDIRQMYRQILIDPQDLPYQSILWRESPDQPIKTFVLTTVTYGVASAPFLALRTLQQLVHDEGHKFPNASNVLKNNIFIDDIIAGADSIDDAVSLKQELCALLSLGGFELRKWSSNSSALLTDVPIDHQLLSNINLSSQDSCITLLGLSWNPKTDNFICRFPNSSHLTMSNLNKRKLLSLIAQIYDPCGWIAPSVMVAKCILQQLWLLALGWDDPLLPESVPNLSNFLDSLHNFSEVSIPRLVLIPSATYQLHGFCDASQRGYTAVIYLRSSTQTNVSSSLLLCKTRVAPLRTITLPRLELLGAYLLAHLICDCVNLFKNCITLDSVHLWCDSTIVLTWIQTLPYKLKTFIANRVTFIQEHTLASWWHYVPSEQNIADIPSRGIIPTDLLDNQPWFVGPPWLSQSSQYWPKQISKPSIDRNLLELKPLCLTTTVDIPNVDLFHHVSSWPRAVTIVSRIFQAWLPSSSLSLVQRYQKAELALCKYIQSVAFAQELKCLQVMTPCSKHIQQLYPFVENGVIRVGGRLKNSSLSYSRKHPILLPATHHLVRSLVDHYHVAHAHCGPSLLHSLIVQKFWIISSRRLVRSRVRQCVRCFRTNPSNSVPRMGDLPTSRVTPSPAFFHTGMDFAGPFSIKLSSLRKPVTSKFYLCIFVCFATKAVHLEVVEDLSTPAFIDTLHRFISRRGLPAHLYSDCGTNFVGANMELKRNLKIFLNDPQTQNSICSFTSPKGIDFHFLPPASPHQGGLWESAVKSAKYHLRRVLGTHIPTLIQFLTLTNRIEAILNSRPLSSMSTDPTDLTFLTPSHFLIGRHLDTFPESDLVVTPDNRLKHFQLVHAMTQRFWQKWHMHYLPNLQRRAKWYKTVPNLDIGDLVLILEPNTPPLSWPIGRVVKICPGSDGVVRVVHVRTTKGQYTRPVTKLYRLP